MRLKIVVFLICGMLTILGTSQVFATEKIYNMEEQKKWTFSKIIWELGIIHNKSEYVASAEQLAAKLTDQTIPSKDKIAKFLSGSHYFGGSTILYLISESSFPIVAYTYSKSLALGINCIASDTVFNTLKLDEYQRAGKVITKILFPYVKDLHNNLKGSSFKYFIVSLCYGSKNFIEESEVLNLKSEMVIAIFKFKDISLFAQGQITDQDLIDKSSIYLSGRDDIAESRRIKINLQK